MYALHNIKKLVDDDNNETVFDNMVHDGIISIKDKDSLKKIAIVEHVDVSNLHEPSSDDESDY